MTAIEVLAEAIAVLDQCREAPSAGYIAQLEALAGIVPAVVDDPDSRVAALQIKNAAQMVEWCRGYVEGS